jgi:hypothetical protein
MWMKCEVLLGHQLDLRIAHDSHAVFLDGFPVVRDHVFGRLAHVLDYDLGHRPHPTLAGAQAPMLGRPFLGQR